MPTRKEREYYRMGFADGLKSSQKEFDYFGYVGEAKQGFTPRFRGRKDASLGLTKPKRKLSDWNKYVKANSKKPRFRYRNGKLNLKKMAVAFRKTQKRGGKR